MKNTDWNLLEEKELIAVARKLKKEKNCFVIAHNYQFTNVQEIADYVGDSLQMAKAAAKTDAEILLVCGIKIMAETAKMLNPRKKVLLSHNKARCPLAEMKKVEELRELKRKHPNAEIVCYVNSTTDLKAESTILCTSGNISKIISSLPKNKEIIVIPDSNIGLWAAHQTRRNIILWDGYCSVHNQITLAEAQSIKQKYPDFKLLVHPECNLEICKFADEVLSTSQMIEYTKNHDKIIIGTEIGLYYQLKKKYPKKKIVPLSERMICDGMKITTLKEAVQTLAEERNEITLPAALMEKAKKPLTRMYSVLQKNV